MGIDEEPVWVIGIEEPLPTMILVEEEFGVDERRLPEPCAM